MSGGFGQGRTRSKGPQMNMQGLGGGNASRAPMLPPQQPNGLQNVNGKKAAYNGGLGAFDRKTIENEDKDMSNVGMGELLARIE